MESFRIRNITPAEDVALSYNCYPDQQASTLRHQSLERPLTGRLPEFQPITAESMETIYDFIRNQTARTTDLSYLGIWMWTDCFHYEYCIYADTLFMKGDAVDGSAQPMFSFPVGKLSPRRSIELIKRYCQRHGLTPRIFCCDHYAEILRNHDPSLIMTRAEDWDEYLYPIDKLATFSGKKLSKKRNHLNAFHTTYPDFTVSEIRPDDIAELLDFCERFHMSHDDDAMSCYETMATAECLRIYEHCHCEGLLIRIDGKIAGFTMGEVMGDTLITHIEKGDIGYRGIYQALCSEFCSMEMARHPELVYVNREDDSGNENLRKSKLSYYPCSMVEKFVVLL